MSVRGGFSQGRFGRGGSTVGKGTFRDPRVALHFDVVEQDHDSGVGATAEFASTPRRVVAEANVPAVTLGGSQPVRDLPGDASPRLGSPVAVPCTAWTPGHVAHDQVDEEEDAFVEQISRRVTRNILMQLEHITSTPVGGAPAVVGESMPVKDSKVSHDVQMPNVSRVFQRELKEPPSFRGDGSDSVSVHEWEELMRGFVKKGGFTLDETVEEILAHLRGKARDVVKVGARNSNIDLMRNPEAIYAILRRHFEPASCSTLPLADFYATVPARGEGAFDYWLRLNRAADVAAARSAHGL